MSTDILGQLRQLLSPNMGNGGQAIYDPNQFYKPMPGGNATNPYIPWTWGEGLGNFLGGIANQRMGQRNSQEQMLEQAWQTAMQAGPQAAIAFLNNPQLPQWFKGQVLAGITPDTFQSQLDTQQRGIYDSVRSAISEILKNASQMDPAQADQYIALELQKLQTQYARAGIDAKAFAIPKDAQGHYINPFAAGQGKQDLADAQAAADKMMAEVNNLAKTDPASAQALLTKYRAIFIKQYPQFANLLPQNPHPTDVTASADIKGQGLSPAMKVGDYLTKMGFPSRAKVLKDLGLEEILDGPISQYWDSQNHMLDWTAIEKEINNARTLDVRSKAGRGANAKNDPLLIRLNSQISQLSTERKRLYDDLYGNMGMNWAAANHTQQETEAQKKKISDIDEKIAALQGQYNDRLQSLLTEPEPTAGGPAAPGLDKPKPTPETPGAIPPNLQPVVANYKSQLAAAGTDSGKRMVVLKDLRSPVWINTILKNKTLAKAIMTQLGLTPAEQQFMLTGKMPPTPPKSKPAPKPQAQTSDPIDQAVNMLRNMPNPFGQMDITTPQP